jgi:acyl-homoserine-lactone acylase
MPDHGAYRPRRGFPALLLLVLLLSPSCFILKSEFKKSVDPPSGTVSIGGAHGEIVIRRDPFGVPFVEASNESDLFLGSGYVAAEDRLWQMVMMSMLAQGRLSEIAGKGMLNMDVFLRTLDARKHVDEAMRRIGPEARAILESYSRGVNAYLGTHEHLPAEFVLTGYRPAEWKPEDTLYVFYALNLNVSGNFIEELDFLILSERLGYEKAAWLFPVYPDEEIPFEEARKLEDIPAEDLAGLKTVFHALRRQTRERLPMGVPASNNWALSGRRTASGRCIVENDTHLMLMIPNSWMLLHLKCPTYEAAGVTLAGIPYVTLGFNGHVAWGATMVMADTQDLYLEKLRTDGGATRYLYKGDWLPVTERRESFAIKGKKPLDVTLLETRHGPLLNRALEGLPFPPALQVQPMPMTSGYGIAICHAVEGIAETLQAFYELGRARNVAEAQAAARGVQAIYLNLVYGDKDSIAWQVTGSYPLRAKGRGLFPSPGWTGEYDWTGFLAPESRPSVVDPAEGFIATANNRTVPKDFPHQLTSSWYHPDRRDRLASVLERTEGATAESTLELQGEHYSLMAEKIQALLFSEPTHGRLKRIIDGWPDKRKRARALDALEYLRPGRFHAVMAAESDSAAVMGAFMHCVTRETFMDEIGEEGSLLWEAFLDASSTSYPAPEDHLLWRPESPFWDDTATPEREAREEIIAEALEAAVDLLEDEIGSNRAKWQWGKLHTYHWKHDVTKETIFLHCYFNRGPYPAGGDSHSVNVATFTWGDDFHVWTIPAMRMIVDFGRDEPMSLITVPGQSGNPSSPHYGDMIPPFLEGAARPMPFKPENVERQYRDVLRIVD